MTSPNRPPSCDRLKWKMKIPSSVDYFLNLYWDSMPEWCRERWFHDALLHAVIRSSAERGDSVPRMLWNLNRSQCEDREGLRNKLLDDARNQTSFTMLENSIPRRSEVKELLRLVDEAVDWGDLAVVRGDIHRLDQYAEKLRKEWKL